MATRTASQFSNGLHPDTIFALLRDSRRRELLAVLSDRDAPITLTELATAVARRERESEHDEERGTGHEDVPSKTAESVAATLHHHHLPKLADDDVVAYDAEAKTVTDANVEPLAPFRDVIEDGE